MEPKFTDVIPLLYVCVIFCVLLLALCLSKGTDPLLSAIVIMLTFFFGLAGFLLLSGIEGVHVPDSLEQGAYILLAIISITSILTLWLFLWSRARSRSPHTDLKYP